MEEQLFGTSLRITTGNNNNNNNNSGTVSKRESVYCQQFQQYAHQLDAVNEKRERIVKASRDVTTSSKKVIFQIHRINRTNRGAALEQAERDLHAVQNIHVRRVAQELKANETWKYKRAFSPGMQEFVEAATTLEFCKTGKLLTLQQLNASLSHLKDVSDAPFSISTGDYLLGVADLTGELMRLAISGVAAGQREAAIAVCGFVQALYKGFSQLPNTVDIRGMPKKMDLMLQSLIKIENTCYAVHVRGLEYPEDMIVNALEREEIDSDQEA